MDFISEFWKIHCDQLPFIYLLWAVTFIYNICTYYMNAAWWQFVEKEHFYHVLKFLVNFLKVIYTVMVSVMVSPDIVSHFVFLDVFFHCPLTPFPADSPCLFSHYMYSTTLPFLTPFRGLPPRQPSPSLLTYTHTHTWIYTTRILHWGSHIREDMVLLFLSLAYFLNMMVSSSIYSLQMT